MDCLEFGELNERSLGIILKELVRRAVRTIREERRNFEFQRKKGYGGEENDIVTTADRAAQDVYVEALRSCFPDFGIVAEEDNLRDQANKKRGYFTVDPLDGTKAFNRGESEGVGTMIGLVDDNEIKAAYVGDANTEELYGFYPGGNVQHISEYDYTETLEAEPDLIDKQFIQLRKRPSRYSDNFENLIRNRFKGLTVESGSIGTKFAHLWKGVVGAIGLPPHYYPPWDLVPILGISKQLGYRFYELVETGLKPYQFELTQSMQYVDKCLLATHPDSIPDSLLAR